MKKMLLVLVAVIFLAGVGWAQEEGFKPSWALSFELGGSVVAPIGVGAEFFLGRHLGLGAELRFLFLSVGGVFGAFIDPGAAVRWYFGDLDSSLFLMGGVSYLTGFAIGGGAAATAPFGFMKPKVAIGYQVLFGKNNRTRFAAELGAVYLWPVVEGELIPTSDIMFPILPHALIMFGRAF